MNSISTDYYTVNSFQQESTDKIDTVRKYLEDLLLKEKISLLLGNSSSAKDNRRTTYQRLFDISVSVDTRLILEFNRYLANIMIYLDKGLNMDSKTVQEIIRKCKGSRIYIIDMQGGKQAYRQPTLKVYFKLFLFFSFFFRADYYTFSAMDVMYCLMDPNKRQTIHMKEFAREFNKLLMNKGIFKNMTIDPSQTKKFFHRNKHMLITNIKYDDKLLTKRELYSFLMSQKHLTGIDLTDDVTFENNLKILDKSAKGFHQNMFHDLISNEQKAYCLNLQKKIIKGAMNQVWTTNAMPIEELYDTGILNLIGRRESTSMIEENSFQKMFMNNIKTRNRFPEEYIYFLSFFDENAEIQNEMEGSKLVKLFSNKNITLPFMIILLMMKIDPPNQHFYKHLPKFLEIFYYYALELAKESMTEQLSLVLLFLMENIDYFNETTKQNIMDDIILCFSEDRYIFPNFSGLMIFYSQYLLNTSGVDFFLTKCLEPLDGMIKLHMKEVVMQSDESTYCFGYLRRCFKMIEFCLEKLAVFNTEAEIVYPDQFCPTCSAELTQLDMIKLSNKIVLSRCCCATLMILRKVSQVDKRKKEIADRVKKEICRVFEMITNDDFFMNFNDPHLCLPAIKLVDFFWEFFMTQAFTKNVALEAKYIDYIQNFVLKLKEYPVNVREKDKMSYNINFNSLQNSMITDIDNHSF